VTFIVFFLLFSELPKGICFNLCGIVLKPGLAVTQDPANLRLKLNWVEEKINKKETGVTR